MQLAPPADQSIITLWLGGIEPDMMEEDIRGVIYPFGQIASFHLLRSAKCAFVEYVDRQAAEEAASQLHKALVVLGRSLSVNWARPKVQEGVGQSSASSSSVMPPPPGMERSNASAYAIPGLAAPKTTWDTNAPDVPAPSQPPSRQGGQRNKRYRDTDVVPVPPRGPPPMSAFAAPGGKSGGLLAGLSGYGEDSDEEAPPQPARQVQAKEKKSNAPQYPSMNQSRIGASL
jgi:RNA recognition motif-containing protein